MGGSQSSQDGVHFSHRDEYQRWTVPNVRGAVRRWHDLQNMRVADGSDAEGVANREQAILERERAREAAEKEKLSMTHKSSKRSSFFEELSLPVFFRPSKYLSRREFVDVFTDYDTVVGGQFLALPIKQFRRFDRDDTGRVVADEVLLMLTLWCDAPLPDKIELVFRLFDARGAGELSSQDMKELISAVLGGFYSLGINKLHPKPNELKRVCEDMFRRADVNKDDSVTPEEFGAWAHVALSGRELLKRYAGEGVTKHEDPKKPSFGGALGHLDQKMQRSQLKDGKVQPSPAAGKVLPSPAGASVVSGFAGAMSPKVGSDRGSVRGSVRGGAGFTGEGAVAAGAGASAAETAGPAGGAALPGRRGRRKSSVCLPGGNPARLLQEMEQAKRDALKAKQAAVAKARQERAAQVEARRAAKERSTGDEPMAAVVRRHSQMMQARRNSFARRNTSILMGPAVSTEAESAASGGGRRSRRGSTVASRRASVVGGRRSRRGSVVQPAKRALAAPQDDDDAIIAGAPNRRSSFELFDPLLSESLARRAQGTEVVGLISFSVSGGAGKGLTPNRAVPASGSGGVSFQVGQTGASGAGVTNKSAPHDQMLAAEAAASDPAAVPEPAERTDIPAPIDLAAAGAAAAAATAAALAAAEEAKASASNAAGASPTLLKQSSARSISLESKGSFRGLGEGKGSFRGLNRGGSFRRDPARPVRGTAVPPSGSASSSSDSSSEEEVEVKPVSVKAPNRGRRASLTAETTDAAPTETRLQGLAPPVKGGMRPGVSFAAPDGPAGTLAPSPKESRRGAERKGQSVSVARLSAAKSSPKSGAAVVARRATSGAALGGGASPTGADSGSDAASPSPGHRGSRPRIGMTRIGPTRFGQSPSNKAKAGDETDDSDDQARNTMAYNKLDKSFRLRRGHTHLSDSDDEDTGDSGAELGAVRRRRAGQSDAQPGTQVLKRKSSRVALQDVGGDSIAAAAAAHGASGPEIDPTESREDFKFRARLVHRQQSVRGKKLKAFSGKRRLRSIANETRFTLADLQVLAESFCDASNVTARLESKAFHAALKLILPAFGSFERKRLMAIYDSEKHAKPCLNFRDFAKCMSTVMRGQLDEKLRLIFRIYDPANTGMINILDLVRFIRQGWARKTVLVTKAIDLANKMMRLLDVDGDGEITRDEFAVSMRRDPQLLETFTQCIAISKKMARALHELAAVHPPYNKESILHLLRGKGGGMDAQSRSSLVRPVTCDEFMVFMAKHFECGDDCEYQVQAIFEAFDSDETGVVVLRDILNGFVQIMGTSSSEQTEYYFDLYDMNGDGTLDRNEIMHMLLSSQTRTNADAAAVIDVLNAFDPTGSGKITEHAFTHEGFRDPIIMETLHHIYELHGDVKSVLKFPVAVPSAAARRFRRASVAAAATRFLGPSPTKHAPVSPAVQAILARASPTEDDDAEVSASPEGAASAGDPYEGEEWASDEDQHQRVLNYAESSSSSEDEASAALVSPTGQYKSISSFVAAKGKPGGGISNAPATQRAPEGRASARVPSPIVLAAPVPPAGVAKVPAARATAVSADVASGVTPPPQRQVKSTSALPSLSGPTTKGASSLSHAASSADSDDDDASAAPAATGNVSGQRGSAHTKSASVLPRAQRLSSDVDAPMRGTTGATAVRLARAEQRASERKAAVKRRPRREVPWKSAVRTTKRDDVAKPEWVDGHLQMAPGARSMQPRSDRLAHRRPAPLRDMDMETPAEKPPVPTQRGSKEPVLEARLPPSELPELLALKTAKPGKRGGGLPIGEPSPLPSTDSAGVMPSTLVSPSEQSYFGDVSVSPGSSGGVAQTVMGGVGTVIDGKVMQPVEDGLPGFWILPEEANKCETVIEVGARTRHEELQARDRQVLGGARGRYKAMARATVSKTRKKQKPKQRSPPRQRAQLSNTGKLLGRGLHLPDVPDDLRVIEGVSMAKQDSSSSLFSGLKLYETKEDRLRAIAMEEDDLEAEHIALGSIFAR